MNYYNFLIDDNKKMYSFCRYTKKIDIFGLDQKLKIEGKTNYKTIPGGIISILYFIILFIISLFSIKDVFLYEKNYVSHNIQNNIDMG